ncbi:hypothetical protein [Stenotrophomonas maltophilia]|uniref:hypothetical protein n=2 Tax=Stenotrophomonas maltophilia TaxID=40324 RepID=UPI000AB9EE11|nr:hypothetical protein [Stenotrophomonas maltophilia]
MTHHRYDRRLPKRTEGFAWGRSIDKVLGGHVLTYRLFRRDLAGKLHIETRTFQLNDHRRHIALQLLIARRVLRERVDAIGYALIEAEAAPATLATVRPAGACSCRRWPPMANQLLTAAMVHVFALAGFAAGIATLWAISRACRAARNGLRWCWRRCAHG